MRPCVAAHSPIATIGHGVSADLLAQMSPPGLRPPGPLRLFTAGGWVPHKRQMLIPQTLRLLQEHGIDPHWEIAGTQVLQTWFEGRLVYERPDS